MTTQELVERLNAWAVSAIKAAYSASLRSEVKDFGARAEVLRAAASRLSEMEAALRAQEWQDIETAPRDGTRVLVWMEPVPDPRYIPSDGPMAVIASYVVWSEAMKREGMKDGWSWYGPVRCQPTHWRPLPTPPAHDKGEPKP